MNIVETEANQFSKRLFKSGKTNTLENLKSKITMKLYDFNRDRDKLDFLKTLRVNSIADKEKHMKTCSGCGYDKEIDIGVFAIDQEIDEINRFYTFEPKPEDEFSVEEESALHIIN